MNYYKESDAKQLVLLNGGIEQKKRLPAKRVNIMSLKVIKESSVLYKGRRIRSPRDSYELIRTFIEESERKMFVLMCLDTKNQPTSIQVCHIGSLNASIVHPREVMKAAVLGNPASIIVFHNHPSGITSPSPEDIEVTKRLSEAGQILGIELLDHLIIGENSFLSFKEKGYL